MAPDSASTAQHDLDALLHEEYRIDPGWYEQAGLSWDFAVRERLCPQARSAEGGSEGRRSVRAGAGGLRFQRGTGRDYSANPLAAIQDLCADSPEYRDPSLPLKEIIFRLLLAGGNQPQSVLALYDGVMEWVKGGDGRVITPEVVQRLLASDRDYGFSRVER